MQLSRRGYKVLYIESLGLRQPQLKSSDLSRIWKRLLKFFKGARKINDSLYVYSPLVFPFHRFKWVRAFNSFWLKFTLKRLQKKYALKQPWAWTYNPMILDLARELGYSKLIYHSVDDLSASPGVDSKSIIEHEDKLLKACDVVFCTSRKIEERCRKVAGSRVHFFGNVVDYEHFSKARGDLPEPEDLKSIKHPRIGFVGALSSYKVDVENISKVAKRNPEWQWVLIGKIGEGQPDADLESLRAYPNIHFLGPKDYQLLPQYLKHFDVTSIPTPLNDYTQSMFPMKFFEYMAAGKPIVARDIHSLAEYRDVFYPYSTGEQLEGQLMSALDRGVPDASMADALARENTWEKRLEKMLKLI